MNTTNGRTSLIVGAGFHSTNKDEFYKVDTCTMAEKNLGIIWATWILGLFHLNGKDAFFLWLA